MSYNLKIVKVKCMQHELLTKSKSLFLVSINSYVTRKSIVYKLYGFNNT